MTPDTRSVIAGIAAVLVNRRDYAWVYDHDRSAHRAVSLSLKDGRTGAYDHERKRVYDGVAGESLFDHAEGQHIGAERTDRGVKGYDHGSKSFYEAFVEGEDVSVYDHATGRHHAYRVS